MGRDDQAGPRRTRADPRSERKLASTHKAAVLKQPEEVIVLSMNVSADLDGRFPDPQSPSQAAEEEGWVSSRGC